MKNSIKKIHRVSLLWLLMMLSLSSASVALEPASRQAAYDGTSLTFDIKKMGVPVGEAVLTLKGLKEIEGKKLYLVHFTSQAPQFFDEEQIYLDPQSLLPKIVLRDIDLFGRIEQIREDYDQQKGIVKIVKTTGKKQEEIIIEKAPPIENLYGFIYRLMLKGEFQKAGQIKLNVPTKDVMMEQKGEKKLKLKINKQPQEWDAHFFESEPKQFRIWFSTQPHHYPLRIDGSLGFGNTYMVLKGFKGQSVGQ